MRSVSPVMVGMTPVLAVKPDWKVRTAGRPLERRQLGFELLVHRHGAGDRAHRTRADAVLADRRERRLAQPRMVGESQVVVRRQADHPPVVDRHDRALGTAHHPQGPVEVALLERSDLVLEEGERVAGGSCRHRVTPSNP
jgi:hypothetical protein